MEYEKNIYFVFTQVLTCWYYTPCVMPRDILFTMRRLLPWPKKELWVKFNHRRLGEVSLNISQGYGGYDISISCKRYEITLFSHLSTQDSPVGCGRVELYANDSYDKPKRYYYKSLWLDKKISQFYLFNVLYGEADIIFEHYKRVDKKYPGAEIYLSFKTECLDVSFHPYLLNPELRYGD